MYRAKIKGFHQEFNVKEKLVYDNELNSGNPKPDKTGGKTALELLENANNLRNQRIRNNELREKIKNDK